MGEARETQWFVHANGTIASFMRCPDRSYFFAKTGERLVPAIRIPAYGQAWTQLHSVPEWVLKHFSVLEFVRGADIDVFS